MRFIPVAKDLHGRSPVVSISHDSAAARPFKPFMACAVFALTLASAFGATTAQATNAVGAVSGAAGVSATGAATYTIPISLPPGTNGMQPSVALSYNSQSGEGAAGYGWTLSGLSAITRCNQTIEDEGKTQAVQFIGPGSTSDVFCLDGQKLYFKSGSTYGADGAVYNTPIESFSKIVSHGSGTSGPAYFTVQTKDGRLFEYGNTTDSAIYAVGTTITRVWALDKVTDLNGNYYAVTYQNNDTTTGDYWPLNIVYGGNSNAGTTGLHKVVFSWTPRSDSSVQATYLVGSLITQTQLLSAVTVKYNGTATFTYTLIYQTDPANFRNQLQSVTECDANSNCLPATTIQWQNGAAGWGADQDTGVSVPDIAHATASHLMDVDGDGIMDLVYPDAATSHWMVMFGQPGGGFTAPVDTGDALWQGTFYQHAIPMDYNGDGRMDLLLAVSATNGWQLLEATGNRTAGVGGVFNIVTPSFPNLSANNSVTNQPIYAGSVWAVDFFGRGLTDLAYSDGTNVYLAENGVPYSIYSAAPVVFSEQSSTELRSTNNNFIDTPVAFDASGRPGAVTYFDTVHTCQVDGCTPPPDTIGYHALQASGGTGSPAFLYLGSIDLPEAVPEPMSATGGGLTDLLASSGSNYVIAVATNSNAGFNLISTGVGDAQTTDDVITDYYGDGRQEALVKSGSSYSLIRLNYSLASQSFVPVTTAASAATPSGYVIGSMRIGNIEATGLDDLVYAVSASGGGYDWHYKLHNGYTSAPDVVTSITDGFGYVCTFQYSSLASGTVYTENSGAQYPIKDVQLPMQVVSIYTETDGAGGTYELDYTYTGARFDSWGRGFLGFAGRTVKDDFRGTTETIAYQQTFPWTGMVMSDMTGITGGTTISDTENSQSDKLSLVDTYHTTYFPFFDVSTTTLSDIGSSGIETLSTAKTTLAQGDFDAYGNYTGTQTQSAGQQTTVVEGAGTYLTGAVDQFAINKMTQYASPNTSTYCVGLPQGETIQRASPTGSLSRTMSSTSVDTTKCRLNSQSIQSSDGTTSLTTSYTYDGVGNVNETDVSGTNVSLSPRKTQYDFTGGNSEFPTTITYFVSPANLVTHASWRYDLGLKASDTDANGLTTTYTPDGFGRITSVARPDGTQTQYTYAWCSSPTAGVTCPNNGVFEVTTTQVSSGGGTSITTGFSAYDMKGRVVRQGNVLLGGVMSLVDTTYDSAGHALTVTRPHFSGQTVFKTTYTYDDVFNRVTMISEPENSGEQSLASYTDKTTLSYGLGSVSGTGYGVTASRQVNAGVQNTTKYTDVLGEVVEMVDANTGNTTYSYDAFGDLVGTKDADNNQTTLNYDGLGHKTAMTDPNMGHWTYQVDALGEVLCQTDANQQSIILTYDALGRVTQKLATPAGGGCSATSGTTGVTTSTWAYDQTGSLGLPASVSDSNGFQRGYAYDTLGRPNAVTTTIGSTPYTVSTGYDTFGRVQTVTYPVSVTPNTTSAPVAVATPSSGTTALNVGINLNGSGSTDPNGLPIDYAWSQVSGPANGIFTATNTAQTTFSSATPGSYSLQLVAADADSASAPAPVTVAVQPAAPGFAPTVIPLPPNYNLPVNVNLSWQAVAGATSYQIYDSTNGTTYSLLQTVNGATSASVALTVGGTYHFTVAACENGACSVQSPPAPGGGLFVDIPATPTGLAISPTGTSTTGNFTLSWSETGSITASNYQVYQSSGGAYTQVANPTTASASISGLSNGTYTYYVIACNHVGCGYPSTTISETVSLPPAPPGAPTSLNANPFKVLPGGAFTLSWSAATGTVGYYLLVNTSAQYSASTLSVVLTAPSTQGFYTYQVEACNTYGCSSAASKTIQVSNQGSASIIKVPASGGATELNASSLTMLAAAGAVDRPVEQGESATLMDLAKARQTYAAALPRQVPEAAIEAAAARRAQERLPAVLPAASSRDVTAWNASQADRMRMDPRGPAFAPPAYIAYGGARMTPATGTPYQFAVQYNYDPSSGAMQSVQNAQTGFVYWQAATGGSSAPVDAFGHLLAYTDGNNVSTVLTYDEATAVTTGIGTGVGSSSAVQKLAYSWDGFGNLTQRCDANKGLTEAFTYDSLNRISTSAVSSGGTLGSCAAGPTAGPSISMAYSNSGNIQSLTNSGNTAIGGTYTYDPLHPHAVSTVSNIPGTYSYDANGNMTCRAGTGTGCTGGTTITWNADNLPTQITGPNGSSTFSYGPDMQRYQQVATDSSGTTTTSYIGSLFEVVTEGSNTQYRHNIMAVGGIVAVHTIDQSGNVQTNYIHSDHLGSSDTITSDNGTVAQEMSFDAFGLRRDPTNWAYDLTSTQIAGLKGITDKGYTAQEQLDNVGLVHMNGRVYDPSVGRFISADPVQGPNRYSYVGNNPLRYTDPSGYCFAGCFWQPSAPSKILSGQSNVTNLLLTGAPTAVWSATHHVHWETQHNQYVQLAVVIVASYYTGGLASDAFGSGFWGSVGTGAVAGGTASGGMAALNSETPGQVLGAAGRGAAAGAVSGGLLYGANDITAYANNNFAVGFVSHGVAGGLSSVAAGGSFNRGFEFGAGVYSAYVGYQSMVNGESPSANSGNGAVYKQDGDATAESQVNNNFGPANVTNDPGLVGTSVSDPCGGCEGSTFSNAMNSVPGMNATATLHDVWGDMYQTANGGAYPLWFNVSTQLPAAAVSYTGLLNTTIGYGLSAGVVTNRDGGP